MKKIKKLKTQNKIKLQNNDPEIYAKNPVEYLEQELDFIEKTDIICFGNSKEKVAHWLPFASKWPSGIMKDMYIAFIKAQINAYNSKKNKYIQQI